MLLDAPGASNARPLHVARCLLLSHVATWRTTAGLPCVGEQAAGVALIVGALRECIRCLRPRPVNCPCANGLLGAEAPAEQALVGFFTGAVPRVCVC